MLVSMGLPMGWRAGSPGGGGEEQEEEEEEGEWVLPIYSLHGANPVRRDSLEGKPRITVRGVR